MSTGRLLPEKNDSNSSTAVKRDQVDARIMLYVFHFQIEFHNLLSTKKSDDYFFQENLNNHRFFMRFG